MRGRFAVIWPMITFLLITGCVGPMGPMGGVSTYVVKDYEVGKQSEVTVGSVMMAWETGVDGAPLSFASALSGAPLIASGLRKELLYGGIAQNIVHVTYREFTVENRLAGFARPAFSQELQYDISKLDRITFRDIRIQVISADSEKIIFSILQGPTEVEKAQENKPTAPSTNTDF